MKKTPKIVYAGTFCSVALGRVLTGRPRGKITSNRQPVPGAAEKASSWPISWFRGGSPIAEKRFHQAVLEARDIGIHVHLHPGCEAIDVLEAGNDRVRVKVRSADSCEQRVIHADRVLLATGHWFDQGQMGGYFTSPWPPVHLQDNIPAGSDVAIIGTSLSAIDAVLTLTADGDFRQSHSSELLYQPSFNPRRLFLYSRKALLPRVRGRTGPYRNQFMMDS